MAIKNSSDDSDTSDALDILSDLKGEDNTIVTNPIDASFELENTTDTMTNDIEKTLVKADKTFYTGSNMFTKNDFEDFSTLTKELSKSNTKKKVFLIILILIVLLACSYLILKNYIIK